MKAIKNILSIFILGILFQNLISCKGEPCSDVVCGNGGVCSNGTCTCPTGYEGVRCETIMRDKLLGTFTVTEDGSASLPVSYTTNIHTVTGADINKVKIKNFYNYFVDEVYGIVYGDSLDIPSQNIDGWIVVGHGTYIAQKYYGASGNMKLNYKVTNPNGVVNYIGEGGGTSSEWSK